MATKAKAPAKRRGAGIRLAPERTTETPVPFGTAVCKVDAPWCVNVVRGSVSYGPWERERWNAKTLHGALQLEFNPDGYEPVVQMAVGPTRVGDPLDYSAGHNFDFMEIEEFDAFVSLLVSLRDTLFASGMVTRPKLIPLESEKARFLADRGL